ncbi:MAG: hypothetical protein ACLS5G_07365 [Streptococcus sp.]
MTGFSFSSIGAGCSLFFVGVFVSSTGIGSLTFSTEVFVADASEVAVLIGVALFTDYLDCNFLLKVISTGDSLANSDDATSLLGASLRTVLVLVGSSVLVEIGFVVVA